ncbi:hypothetical protein [Paenibacillus jilunlii]|uniref:ABC-2 type transport system permease protein n=1 Tax=Paenibacillus jilunlii TaxID=682956 RepID=A0A1G9U8A3_9BACL|nr:hypothetical protein [Paenibacillus jilunlii]KWX76271.1 hypothetical protein AML91_10455 [Paenibacillus jilunlii]SDM56217.1 hypothetical protein SAMN05216191_11461 [Paenibacillus jilunlii]
MNDFWVLKLLDRLQGGFRRAGVDYKMLRSILQVKLTMDGRRTPTVLRTQKGSQGTEGSPLRVQWIYLLLGLMLILFVVPGSNYMLMMSVLFAVIMFMITTTLISDFSSVMLDLRDKNILFSKPVDRRTLNMAKSLHILIYLVTLTLTLTAPSLVVALFKQGVLFFLVYAAMILLMDCFILVITALLYLLILRVFDGEKLKDIINYIQIILSVGIAVGYQLVPRLFDMTDLTASFQPAWWQYFIAPVWFAAPFEVLVGGNHGVDFTVLAAMSVIVPLVVLLGYIKLMPLFEQSLQKLAEQGAAGKENGRYSGLLSGWLCRDKAEAMFFRFTWSMMRNERDFKLKVYPTVGLSLILPFIFIFNQAWTSDHSLNTESKAYLFIYLCALLLLTAVQMLRYSSSYKGAWIYTAIPLPETAPVYRGMLKAVLLRLMLPLFVLESAVFLWLFGPRILPDLAGVMLVLPLFAVICFRMLPRALPFSEKYEAAKQKDFTGSGFVLLFILMGLAGLHYVVSLLPLGIYIYLVILAAVNVWAWRAAFPHEGSRPGQIPTLGA